jgi:hypothetical protein
MRYALEQGINFLDTARIYHDGNNERWVGEAIQGIRDKVYLATKFVIEGKDGALLPKEEMMASVDKSLRELRTDYIDIMFLHHMSSVEQVMYEPAREVLVEAQKQGKIRFLGVSTHANEAVVLDAMVADAAKLYDAAMVTYNFKSDPAIKEAIARAAKAGIGIVAMKTQAGGYETKELGDISPNQAALKWVLQDANVSTTVPSMVNLDQIKEDVAVMHMDFKLTRAESQILERYGKAIAPYYCLRCGQCEGTCPQGVDIPTVNRCLMYAEGYRDLVVARQTYDALMPRVSAAQCAQCGVCAARCAHGLDIAAQMRRAQTFFC